MSDIRKKYKITVKNSRGKVLKSFERKTLAAADKIYFEYAENPQYENCRIQVTEILYRLV